MSYVDKLVAKHTAFSDMEDLANTHRNYRPSINCLTNKKVGEKLELQMIADRYDLIMNIRGDARRAYRY